MKHCVATYAASCARGACSIWSLERRRGGEERGESLLTVEIDAKGVMVQARGFRNRGRPIRKERTAIWMREAG